MMQVTLKGNKNIAFLHWPLLLCGSKIDINTIILKRIDHKQKRK